MRAPLTADERERRFVQYIRTLNKEQLSELILTRLNRVSNFRKTLIQLLEDFIEARAEVIAASMLMEDAPARPEQTAAVVAVKTLPAKRRRIPIWLEEEGKAVKTRVSS